MGLLDIVIVPLRAILDSAERAAERTSPVQHVERRVLETVASIRDATEQIEAHVAVLETLASSMTPLTQAVEKLSEQLQVVSDVLAPVAAAEHDLSDAEHEVTRLGHLFGRHQQ